MYNPPIFHSYFSFSSIEDDLRIVKEAINSIEGELWKKAMEEEMESLRENETLDLLTLFNGRNSIGSKLVFKKRRNIVG